MIVNTIGFTLALITPLMLGGMAHADTVSYNQVLTLSPGETVGPGLSYLGVELDLDFDVTLPQFNPALGTLTGVSLQRQASNVTDPSVEITNTGSTDASGSGMHITTFGYNFPGGLATGAGGPSGSFSFNVAGGGTTTVNLQPFPNLSGPLGSPTDLSPYIGTGNFNGSFSSTSSLSPFSVTGVGDLITTTTGGATVDFIVTYTYDPIPEPASAALLGIGVIGLLRHRCRRAACEG